VLQLARERQVVQALHARHLLRNDLPPMCIAREPIDDAVPRGPSPLHRRASSTRHQTPLNPSARLYKRDARKFLNSRIAATHVAGRTRTLDGSMVDLWKKRQLRNH